MPRCCYYHWLIVTALNFFSFDVKFQREHNYAENSSAVYMIFLNKCFEPTMMATLAASNTFPALLLQNTFCPLLEIQR